MRHGLFFPSRSVTTQQSPDIRAFKFEHELAKQSYKTPLERKQYFEQQHPGVELVEAFNLDDFYSVIRDGTLYNVHRGSTTKKDWTQSDVQLAMNELESSDRLLTSKELSRTAIDRYGLPTVEVGHSLGGTLAEKIAVAHGTRSVAFNMGTTPLDNYQQVDRQKHIHFRMEGDSISQFDPTATTLHAIPQPGLNASFLLPLFQPTLPTLLQTAVGTYVQHTLSAFEPLLA